MDAPTRSDAARTNGPGAVVRQDGVERLQLKIGGLHCSLCTRSIERALGRLPGVREVHVSLAHEEAVVAYDPARVEPGAIRATLAELGYAVHPPDEAARAAEERELAGARRAAVLAGGLLLAAAGVMLATLLLGPSGGRTLAMAALALGTALGPARFILVRNGRQSLRRGILNQDVLVTAAALGGLAGGAAGLVLPGWPAGGFFGATTFVLGFHLIGGYTSVLVHVRASQAVRQLLALQPPTAHRLGPDGREVEVRLEAVAVGDRIRVRPGERVPVDGVVEAGSSAVDESLVTGEAMPRDVLPGDEVVGGALNQTGSLVVRVTRVGEATFLRTVARQVAEARALKPGILRLVDRVLLVYVPAVFAAAAAGLLLWSAGAWVATGEPDLRRAGFAAVSALIMGYPCALGMATPLAIIRASGEAAQQGILMRSGEAFHVYREVRTVVFDKTGTLTEGRPALVAVLPLDGPIGDDRALLRLAAAAERPSEHPLARAVVGAAEAAGLAPPAPATFEARPGRGIVATVDGRAVLVGSPGLLREAGIDPAPLVPLLGAERRRRRTAVLVAVDGAPTGLLALADRLKSDAAATVAALRERGITPVLLTGDHWETARAVAAAAGIAEVQAEVLPGDKAAAVRRLQARGARVAMVGDGINDAPALMQADVGIAVGTGTDVAIEAADVVVVGERLWPVVVAWELARRSYRLTATNVALALGVNGAGVTAAVSGLVPPAWAMLAMAVSVGVVLGHSFAGRVLPRSPGSGRGRRAGRSTGGGYSERSRRT